MKSIFATTISIALAAGAVSAQQTFLSYGDAINTLIDPSSDAFDTFDGPGLSPTSCGQLYEDAFDFLTPAENRDPTKIGPNLFRNCNVAVNNAFGSTRSLGFAGDIPTSTFVPFDTDRVRQQIRDGENSADATTGTEGLTISSRGRAGQQFYVWSEVGTTDVDATVHEPSQESDSVTFGATFLTARGNGGISLSVGRTDGRSAPPVRSVQDYPFDGDPQDAIYDAYRDACAALSGGRTESAGFGLTGFHTRQLGGADLQVYAGAAASRTEYSSNLCYYTVQDIVGPLFASRIQGETEKFALSAGAMLSSTVRMGRVTVRPALGVDYTHTRRPGYRETEAEIASVAQAVAGLGAPAPVLNPVLTGASLDYQTQKTDSVRMRIGGSAFLPTGRRGAVSASAFFVKEFHDDPQIVTATFNEDLRDTPTRFSFLTNPLPSDYLEVGIGYHRGADRPGGFGWDIRVASRLGDSIYETRSVSLMVRSEF